MKDIEQVTRQIKNMRTKTGVSNIFLVGKKLNEFLLQDNVTACFNEHVVLIKRQTEFCTRLYYFADDVSALKTIPQLIYPQDPRPIMMDIIGKDGVPEKICDMMCECGFSHYITFGKWTGNRNDLVFKRNYKNQIIWDEPIRYAQLSDLDRVYEILYNTFDKLAYELQDKQTLAKQIENKEVFVTGIDGKIVAFFIVLRPSEHVAMLDYSAVDEDVRGKGACVYIYGYVLQQLPADTKISYYASLKNSVTGRTDGLFGMKKENFSKILVKYEN